MKKAVLGAAALISSATAYAHPGIHHLNGVGHSLAGADEWLTTAAVALWALGMAAIAVGLLKKRRKA